MKVYNYWSALSNTETELESKSFVFSLLVNKVGSYPIWPAQFVEDAVFPFMCIIGFFVNQVAAGVSAYIWVLNSIPFTSESLFMPVPCWLYYYSINTIW